MKELILWCRCGWAKRATPRGGPENLAWLRVFLHQLFRHRRDPTFWVEDESKNGVKKVGESE